jgi:pyruvate,orthophosphate dikinase
MRTEPASSEEAAPTDGGLRVELSPGALPSVPADAAPRTPPSVVLPVAAGEVLVRAAVRDLAARVPRPGGRPLLLSLRSGDDAAGEALFLGLTRAAARWFTSRGAGNGAAAGLRGLQHWFDRHGSQSVPDDVGGQVVAAAAHLRRVRASATLTLSAMPVGLGQGSGSGVAYSCDQVTGHVAVTGSFLAGGTGADLVEDGGVELAGLSPVPGWWHALEQVLVAAGRTARRPVRCEFVVQDGVLWPLAVTPANLAREPLARALFASAHHVAADSAADVAADPGATRDGADSPLSAAEALAAVAAADLRLRPARPRVLDLPVVATGLGVSTGHAGGTAVFSAAAAVEHRAAGGRPVLVLAESRPEDLPGLLASVAVVNVRGGRTSHSAVVARNLRRPCVVALRDARLDELARCVVLPDGGRLRPGDDVTVDGANGFVHRGATAGVPPATTGRDDGLAEAVDWICSAVPDRTRIDVRVNADGAEDAAAGRAAGASGVGLCRLEHAFLGDAHSVLRRALLTTRGADVIEAMAELRAVIRHRVTGLLAEMDGRPVTVRLLDPPRQEFLPDPVALATRVALTGPDTGGVDAVAEELDAVRRLRESDPMLGIRGVRLGVVHPALAVAQLQALVEADLDRRAAGGDPRLEVLVPMVADVRELTAVRDLLVVVGERLAVPEAARRLPVGAMVETPRAALLAGALASAADFLSVGTNDLTALCWGLSRDDADAELLPTYRRRGLLDASPFERFDGDGVGGLVAEAVRRARQVRPDLPVSVCGEHGAEPDAMAVFLATGITAVSCRPSSVASARLSAACAAVGRRATGTEAP